MSLTHALIDDEVRRIGTLLDDTLQSWRIERERLFAELLSDVQRFSVMLQVRQGDTNEALSRTITDRASIVSTLGWISKRDREEKALAASVHAKMQEVARFDAARKLQVQHTLAQVSKLGQRVRGAVETSYQAVMHQGTTTTLVAPQLAGAQRTLDRLRQDLLALQRMAEARVAELAETSTPQIDKWPALLAQAMGSQLPAAPTLRRVAALKPKRKNAPIPGFLLKRFYDKGSLRAAPDGFEMRFTNPIAFSLICGGDPLVVDGKIIPKEAITISCAGNSRRSDQVDANRYLKFPKGAVLEVFVRGVILTPGPHALTMIIELRKLGWVTLQVQDRV